MPASLSAQPHRVALLIPTSREFGRNVYLGITRYIREAGRRWQTMTWITPDTPPQPDEPFDGAVGYLTTEVYADWVAQHATHAVSTSANLRSTELPQVANDDVAVGRLAADHLLRRRFRRFVCVGEHDRPFARDRMAGLLKQVRQHNLRGIRCPSIRTQDIAHTLAKCEFPVAVMATADNLAVRVLNACEQLGLSVPTQVAILGTGDDEMFCETAAVPLSSTHVNGQKVGFEAAALLDELMNGADRPTHRVHIPPVGVTTRQSTDHYAVDDPVVSNALVWIEEHARQRIGVTDLATAMNLSRSTLERRFAKAFDRSPYDVILETRVAMAKRLLMNTDWPLTRIASAAGFSSSQRLCDTFAQHVGCTPIAFRSGSRYHRR